MKTVLIWCIAALLGFTGGVVGQRLSRQSAKMEPSTSTVLRATSFQLVDNTGRVLSTWGVDNKRGRIAIWFNDENGHTRAVFGNHAGERPTETTWAGYRPVVEFDQPDGSTPLLVGVDRWGRPHMVMGDSHWPARIGLGSMESGDVVSNEPPDPNGPWGISFRTVSGAHASLGTTQPHGSKYSTGFIVLANEERSWMRDADKVR